MAISRLKTRVVGGTITAADDDAEWDNIIDELNTHTAAASPHTNHLITTGDTMTGTLTINQDTATSAALVIDGEETTQDAVTIALDALTTGDGVRITSDSTDTSARNLLEVVNDNTAATGALCLDLQQDGAAICAQIDQNADAIALSIDSESTTANVIDILSPATTTGIVLDADADALTTGGIARFTSNSSDTSARDLVSIVQDHASATLAVCLNLDQDADAIALTIDSEATTEHVVDIEGPATTTGNVIDIGDANALTTGKILNLVSDSSDTSARDLVSIVQDHADATLAVCLNLDQDADAIALTIDSEATTEHVIDIEAPATTTGNVIDIGDADALTTGSILNLVSNSSSAGTRSLVSLVNEHASASGTTCITIRQDSNQDAVFVDKEGTGSGACIQADNEGTGHCFLGRQALANTAFELTAEHATFNTVAHRINAVRSGNSAYSFLDCISDSGGTPDTEVILRGDGTILSDNAATTPADYAEMFECDVASGYGVGLFMTLNGDRVRPAKSGEYVVGITSSNPAVLADASWDRWSGKYQKDEFDAYVKTEDGSKVLSEAFDPQKTYIPRTERSEWVAVGLLGKLYVRTEEDITAEYVDVGFNGHAKNGTTYRVLSVKRQKSDDPEGVGYGVVRVLLK